MVKGPEGHLMSQAKCAQKLTVPSLLLVWDPQIHILTYILIFSRAKYNTTFETEKIPKIHS